MDFLDAVGVDRPAHVVGNSLGGAVVMRLAVDDPSPGVEPGAGQQRTHLFTDTGHMPQIERAHESHRLVTEFWSRPGA